MYRNYGDIDFFEYGMLVAHDEVTDKSGFYILCCEPLADEDRYFFGDIYVDISDSWIDKKAVMNYADIKSLETEEDKVQFAIACFEFYGTTQYENRQVFHSMTRREIEKELQYYIISDDVNW